MQNQGEDQPCRIKLEWLPTKHQVPKQGAREFLRLIEPYLMSPRYPVTFWRI